MSHPFAGNLFATDGQRFALAGKVDPDMSEIIKKKPKAWPD